MEEERAEDAGGGGQERHRERITRRGRDLMLSRGAGTVRDVSRVRAPFARLLAALLILGVLALHLPLDALRARAEVAVAASCCGGCASAERSDDGHDEAAQAADDRADAPAPTDGCDSGCHCGCCGGVPIAAEASSFVAPDARGAAPIPARRLRARCAPPLEVFHPPRA